MLFLSGQMSVIDRRISILMFKQACYKHKLWTWLELVHETRGGRVGV